MPPQNFNQLADGVMNCAVGVFGEPVTYIPKDGPQFSVNGIFDDHWEQVDPDTEQVIASNQPMIGFRLADLPKAPEQGDRVIRGGKTYSITDAQEDGVAGVDCLLHEVKT